LIPRTQRPLNKGGLSVIKLFKWSAGAVLAIGITTIAVPAFAQGTPQGNPSEKRLTELLVHARQAYDAGIRDTATTAAETQPAAQAVARPVIRLTPDEAVRRALENNIELAVERLNPLLQDLSLAQVRGIYRPTVTSLVNMSSAMPLPTSLLTGGTKVKNDTINVNAGVTQALPWYGGTVTAFWNNPRTDTTSSFATLNPQYTPQIQVSLAQPLIRNFKIDNTRQSLLTTAISLDISNTTLRARIINTEASTRNAYWDMVAAIRAVDVARQSLSLAEKLVEDNKIRVEVGTLAPIDIVQAEAEAASRRQTLTVAEATRQTAELTLKRLIVANTDDPLWNAVLDPTGTVQVESRTVDLEGAIKRALTDRTDLINARRTLESSDINIRYLRNQTRPDLSATLTYGTRGLGGNTFVRQGNDIIDTIPGGWADAMRTLLKRDYPTWTVGVNFSYPIGQSTQDAQHARAKVQYQQSQAQLRALELQVATEVTNAALQVASTQQRVEAARAARTLSERRLEAEQTKFDVGMQTNFFVVQAQRDLLDAQITELRANLDYQKAIIELERVQAAGK
jgi:outer membrane protein